MADVVITPKIRCDNCGFVEDKRKSQGAGKPEYTKPRIWGSMKAENGHISQQAYGTGKERLDFIDLCPPCAEAAFNAASSALLSRRGETNGG